ncbi:MAG: hypothetical protein ACPLTR_06020 [Thermacetogeniaceae bacterium]
MTSKNVKNEPLTPLSDVFGIISRGKTALTFALYGEKRRWVVVSYLPEKKHPPERKRERRAGGQKRNLETVASAFQPSGILSARNSPTKKLRSVGMRGSGCRLVLHGVWLYL